MPLFLLNLLPVLRRHWRAGLEVALAAALIASASVAVHQHNVAEQAVGARHAAHAWALRLGTLWAQQTEAAVRQRDSVAAKLDTLDHTAPAVITRWRTITAALTQKDGTTVASADSLRHAVPAVPLPDSVQKAGDAVVTQLQACLTDCAAFRLHSAEVEAGLRQHAAFSDSVVISLDDSLRARGAPLHLAGKAKIAGVGALLGALAAAVLLHH